MSIVAQDKDCECESVSYSLGSSALSFGLAANFPDDINGYAAGVFFFFLFCLKGRGGGGSEVVCTCIPIIWLDKDHLARHC